MDPHNHINLLFRRLISVFALADAWIDRWQQEIPGTDIYNAQSGLLSGMINALEKTNNCSDGAKKYAYESLTGQWPTDNAVQLSKENPHEMRKVLRNHLGELLWLLDQEQHVPFVRDNATKKNVIEIATKVHQIMTEHLRLLGPLKDFNSEPRHRACPG